VTYLVLTDGDAHVERLAVRQHLAFDAVELGGIFGIGIWLGIEPLESDVLFAVLLVFGKEVVDMLRINLEL